MDAIKEIESIRTDILDTIAKCECGDDCESVVFLKKIAARLAAISSEVPSDTAKLRETMELFAHANDDGFYGSHQTMHNVVKKAKEALDTPVRNCDRFTSEDKAQVAFLNEVWLISVKDLSQDPFEGWTEQMKERYAKWLMEPAKESEASK